MEQILLILLGAALAVFGSIIVNRMEHARRIRLHFLKNVLPALLDKTFIIGGPRAEAEKGHQARASLLRDGAVLGDKEWRIIEAIEESIEEEILIQRQMREEARRKLDAGEMDPKPREELLTD